MKEEQKTQLLGSYGIELIRKIPMDKITQYINTYMFVYYLSMTQLLHIAFGVVALNTDQFLYGEIEVISFTFNCKFTLFSKCMLDYI